MSGTTNQGISAKQVDDPGVWNLHDELQTISGRPCIIHSSVAFASGADPGSLRSLTFPPPNSLPLPPYQMTPPISQTSKHCGEIWDPLGFTPSRPYPGSAPEPRPLMPYLLCWSCLSLRPGGSRSAGRAPGGGTSGARAPPPPRDPGARPRGPAPPPPGSAPPRPPQYPFSQQTPENPQWIITRQSRCLE